MQNALLVTKEKKEVVNNFVEMLNEDDNSHIELADEVLKAICFINTQPKPHEEIKNLPGLNQKLFKLFFTLTGKE
jgi:hypothetical protein